MRLNWRENVYPCRNCGREFPMSTLDRRMWCPDCRREVIRRATLFARIAALVFAGGLALYIFVFAGTSSRFTIAYMIMIAAAYMLTYKLTQRAAFEVIRDRGVPPPIPKEEGPGGAGQPDG